MLTLCQCLDNSKIFGVPCCKGCIDQVIEDGTSCYQVGCLSEPEPKLYLMHKGDIKLIDKVVEVEFIDQLYLHHIKNISTGHYECEVVNEKNETYFAKLFILKLGKISFLTWRYMMLFTTVLNGIEPLHYKSIINFISPGLNLYLKSLTLLALQIILPLQLLNKN